MKRADIRSLIGKKIETVIVQDVLESSPFVFQIYLTFSDGTFAEFYSPEEISVSSPRVGDAVEIANSMGERPAEVFE